MSKWGNCAASWAAGLAPLVLLIALAIRPLSDVDFWWQNATGRWILDHGISPVEVFTSSRAGSPRVESSWLYCVVLHLLHERLGASGLVVLKAALLAAVFGAAGQVWRGRRTGTLAALALALAVYGSHMRFVVRPELVTMGASVALLILLDRPRMRPWRRAASVAAIQVVWVNCHSMFLLGPAIVGCWAAEPLLTAGRGGARARLRAAAARSGIFALSLASCLLNPYGAAALAVPFHQLATLLRSGAPLAAFAGGGLAVLIGLALASPPVGARGARRHRAALALAVVAGIAAVGTLLLTSARAAAVVRGVVERVSTPDGAYILELRSPLDPLIWGSHTVAGEAVALMAVLAVVLARRRPRPHQVLLLGATLALTLLAVRNVALLALCSAFIVSRGGGVRGSARLRSAPGASAAVAAGRAGLAAACLALAWGAQTNRLYDAERWALQSGLGVSPEEDYSGVADFLDSAGIRDRFFNTHGAGSFLLDRGLRVFVDSRGAADILEEVAFVTASDRLEAVDWVAQRYDLRAFVVETRFLGLIGRLAAHPGWRLAYADPNAVVFLDESVAPDLGRLRMDDDWMRSMRAQLPAVRAPDRAGWLGRLANPRPYYRLAWLCMMAGAYGHSCDLLEDALAIDPAGFPYYDALAYANAASARLARAAEVYDIAISREPGRARLRMDAARVCMGLDRLAEAEAHARSAVRLSGGSAESGFVLGSVLLRQRRDAEAVPLLEAAVRAVPTAPVYHANLATAYLAVGRAEEAAEHLLRAGELDPADAAARRDACRVLVGLGRFQEAARCLSEAERLEPGHPELGELFEMVTFRR